MNKRKTTTATKVASDIEVGARVRGRGDKMGKVLGNNLKDGNQVIAVEWEDGMLEKVNINDVALAPTLEEEFEKTCKAIMPTIQEKLRRAAQLINEAEKLSEESGIPFQPEHDIMFCTPSYIPQSMKKKWDGVDWDLVGELTSAGGSDWGWQTSQTC